MEVALDNIYESEGINEIILPLKELLESKLNLSKQTSNEKSELIQLNKIKRICLIASLSQNYKRTTDDLDNYPKSRSGQRYIATFFSHGNRRSLFSALLKLRYNDCNVDWQDSLVVSKIIGKEMKKGLEFLMADNNLNSFLFASNGRRGFSSTIPALELVIGEYADNIEAKLNINGRNVTNAQIIIAGATGSGKSNLLAVLIQQFRSLSSETPYPVNFLLFDYKGEFSDPANNHWLANFDVDRTCILNPMEKPLPFTPFKDFTGKAINEINLYSTQMAEALCSIDAARISANMSDRLSQAIINAYNETNGKPITFELILSNYKKLLKNTDQDSVVSVLNQLVRNKLFADKDQIDIINECLIIDLGQFPKDGPLAKAIVYFTTSKLYNIYDQLPKQATSDDYVQIRHFTIIDEAHYMLDFKNEPLKNLIAVGRNKGLSIILATQNMASFQSKHFDFYANAHYPLIMKQQTIDDKVIKDLFGVSGNAFNNIKIAISSLQKGELIIKDNSMAQLGIQGKNYKKINITHLI